jgi:hypothetical protein
MQARVRLVVVALFTLVLPAAAAAQDVSAVPPASGVAPLVASMSAPGAPDAGPTIDGTATAFRTVAHMSPFDAAALQRRQSAGKPVALMIVGGAAILIGAIIGDAPGTLFMVGGAVGLLYGLYLYLQ